MSRYKRFYHQNSVGISVLYAVRHVTRRSTSHQVYCGGITFPSAVSGAAIWSTDTT